MLEKVLNKYYNWKAKLRMERATRFENAKSQLMIDFYSSFKRDDKKAEADRKLKINNLQQMIDFNKKYIEFLTK